MALAALLLVAGFLATAHGSVPFGYGDLWRALRHHDPESVLPTILYQVRLPRAVVAGLVGAALAASGAALQGLFRNPMADPGIIGVSSGGAVGGVAAFTTGLYARSVYALPLLAFSGALAATVTVYALSRRLGRGGTTALLLTGMALGTMLGALASLLITVTVYQQDVLREIVFWLAGGLEARSWIHVKLIALPVALGLGVLIRYGRELNLLLLGEEEARTLGVDARRVRNRVLLGAALATGSAVSVSGIIGFVGLIVPHMLRLGFGADHRWLLPASALGGASFLILADTLGRVVYGAVEIRVGIITALCGAPFFLYLLYRRGLSSAH